MAGWHPNNIIVKEDTGTFAVQTLLPRLPVPPLAQLLSAYLSAVAPLLSEDELRETKKKVEEFGRPSGLGEALREYLVFKAENCRHRVDYPHCSWLEEWWEDLAYLIWRDPIAVFVNYFGTSMEAKPAPALPRSDLPASFLNGPSEHGWLDGLRAGGLRRASLLIGGMLRFKKALESNTATVDTLGRGGALPLCMFQYTRIFATNRTPGLKKDVMHTYPNARHMTVNFRGQWWAVEVLKSNGAIHSTVSIAQALRKIIQSTIAAEKKGQRQLPVAAFTADRRDQWAQNRELLRASESNAFSVDLMERSLFSFVLLDGCGPSDKVSLMRKAQEGEEGTIWFDKAVTMLIYEDGVTLFNGEHTAADAPVPSRMLAEAVGYVHEQEASGIAFVDAEEDEEQDGMPEPMLVKWELDEELRSRLQTSVGFYHSLRENNLLATVCCEGVGRNLLKALKCGPDSFVQMALLLAFYRDQGRVTGTYESATTRTFFHGRTETIRSLSSESSQFVKAMDDSSVRWDTKRSLFRNAVAAHGQYGRMCLIGHGVDRAMLGLRVAAAEVGMETPDIFKDVAYQRFNNIELSTSQMAYDTEEYPGFGAPSPSAYGVCYVCRLPDKLLMTVTSHRQSFPSKNAHKFAKEIEKSVEDIVKLLKMEDKHKL